LNRVETPVKASKRWLIVISDNSRFIKEYSARNFSDAVKKYKRLIEKTDYTNPANRKSYLNRNKN
jgi:hypothetical protein